MIISVFQGRQDKIFNNIKRKYITNSNLKNHNSYTKIKKNNILATISCVDPIWDGPRKIVPCKIPTQKVRIVICLNICPRLSLQTNIYHHICHTRLKTNLKQGLSHYRSTFLLQQMHFVPFLFFTRYWPNQAWVWPSRMDLAVQCLVWFNWNLVPSQAPSPGFSRFTCLGNLGL